MSGLIGTTFWQQLGESETDPQTLATARARSVARARSARALLDRRGELPLDWYDERLYLGVANRSGIDSQMRGEQPYAARDGATVVAVDGALIGAQALRRELGHHAFRGNGAAELILQAYRAWGPAELLRRLRGHFAFALYDRAAGRLLLARDALGSRPLYYRIGADGVQFASELRVLRQLLETPPSIDHTAALDFLTYGFVPAPKSMYRDVHKLPAGHWLDVDLRSASASVHCHWSPPPAGEVSQTESDFAARARDLFGRAYDDRRAPGRDALFCDFGPALADFSAARADGGRSGHAAAARIGSVGAPAFDPDCRDWFDEPLLTVDLPARVQALNAMGPRSRAESSAQVVLADVGLPILSGAAPRYDAVRKGRWVARLRGSLRRQTPAEAGLFERYGLALGGLPKATRDAQRDAWEIPTDYDDHWLFAAHHFPPSEQDQSGKAGLDALRRLDLQTLVPDRLLTELDRLGARAGVDIRTPFLDQDLLDWVLAAPLDLAGVDIARVLLPGAARASLLDRMSSRLQRTGRALRATVDGPGSAPASERLSRLKVQYPELLSL